MIQSKKLFYVFFSMNILFYEYVIYEFLLFYEFFPSMKSRSVSEPLSFLFIDLIAFKKHGQLSLVDT